MLGPLLAHTILTRLLCPRCQSRLTAVGWRYASRVQNHYDILGIQKSASQAEVRAAFLALSKQLHPDINRKDPQNHDKFVELNEAYTILRQPMTRREYDLNLAVRVQMAHQARNASSSHVYGSSAWPGSTSDKQYEARQQRFWDETIWEMRDKAKDKDWEGKPYYSFTDRPRVSNLDIVMCCLAFMAIGAVMHYFAIRKSTEMHKARLDLKDKTYHSNLTKARSNAKIHGNALQLQILKSKVNKTPLEGVPEETVRETFNVSK